MSEIIKEKKYSLEAAIEAMLFVAGEPVTARELAAALNVKAVAVEEAIKMLSNQYSNRGLAVQESKGRYQLTTASGMAEVVESFLGFETSSKLSRAAIETLTIVAYQQPITRPRIDSFRGVNSDGVIRTLVSKGLVEEIGRAEGPGRPVLYATSDEFLQHFGLNSIRELPSYIVDNEVVDESNLLKD